MTFLNLITLGEKYPKVTTEKEKFLELMKNQEINFSLVNQELS